VTFYGVDGHVMCATEMSTKTGRFRFVTGKAVFASALVTCNGTTALGCIIEGGISAVWRDSTTNITSLAVSFPSITVFNGEVTLWGIR
jgi:hypothetical protein